MKSKGSKKIETGEPSFYRKQITSFTRNDTTNKKAGETSLTMIHQSNYYKQANETH